MLKCSECHFWNLIEDEPVLAENNGITQGACHRMPPSATAVVMPLINKITQQMVPQMLDRTAWPITTSVMWCGEGKPVVEPLVVPDDDLVEKIKQFKPGRLKV